MADDDYSDFISADSGSSNGTGNVRVMSEWVPGEPRTYATQYGPEGNPLEFGVSAAVSPNLAQGHQLHEPFEVYQDGNLVGRYNYDDRSFYQPGMPTYNTVERYGLPDIGRGYSIKWLGQNASDDDYSGFIVAGRSEDNDYSGFISADQKPGSSRQEVTSQKQPTPTVVDPTGEAAAGTMAGEGPGTGGRPDRSLPYVTPPKKDDYSGFNTVESPPQNKAWNLGQSIKNIWDSALAKSAQMGLGAAQAETQQSPLGSDPYEQRIKEIQIDPMLSDQERQKQTDEVKLLQEEHREKVVPKAQEAYTAAQKQVEADKPSSVERFLGSAVPYVASGVVGLPAGMTGMSAIVAAQQWSSEMYADVLRDSVDKAKKADPNLSDAEVMKKAVKAAQEASKGSSVAGLALSLLHIDVPGAWPILGRIAAKVGLGAATMEVANTLAEVQKNMAIKKDVDPKQDLLGQLRKVEFHLTNAAAGGGFGGLHGLGGEIGRPSHVPIEDRVPIAEVPDTTELTPAEKAKQETEAAFQQAKKEVEKQDLEERLPRGYHFETDEHGMTWTVAPDGTKVQGKQIPYTEEDAAKIPVQQELPLEPVTGTDPWLSSIANRYMQERQATGEIGAITPGTGTSPEAQLARGLAMGPEEIAQHVSDLMQDRGNFRDHAAAVRVEEARLSQQSSQLSRIAEANPDDPIAQRNSEDAFKYLTDFHNGPVAKLKNQWHAAGEAMQGAIEVDLGSFNGLREQWLRDVGKEPSKDVQAKMRDTARKVREAQAAEKNAMKTLSDEIEKQTARRKLPTEEQVRKNILARMNGDNPCGL